MKYYRDNEGFIYKKTGENAQTLYLDCLNEPSCLAGARYSKQTGEVKKLAVHSDEKPSEHVVMKIIFEASLKNAAREAENHGISVLNLYKRAIAANPFIWLPTNHKTCFLTKLRRIRKYEKEKGSVVPATVDVATSPMPSSPRTRSQTISNATTSKTPTNMPGKGQTQKSPISASVATSPMPSSSCNRSQINQKVSMSQTPTKIPTPISTASVLSTASKSANGLQKIGRQNSLICQAIENCSNKNTVIFLAKFFMNFIQKIKQSLYFYSQYARKSTSD